MQDVGNLDKFKQRNAVNKRYLHSPSHMLADEISQKLQDPKHFALYLKMALTHDHATIRHLLGQVLEKTGVKNPGKLFTFLVGQIPKPKPETSEKLTPLTPAASKLSLPKT